MSLINELRIKSNNSDNKKQEVISEIKEYFDNYLNRVINQEDLYYEKC